MSFAEIGVKAAVGKLSVAADLREHVLRTGVQALPLNADHGLAVADRRIADYDVPLLDAG